MMTFTTSLEHFLLTKQDKEGRVEGGGIPGGDRKNAQVLEAFVR